MKRHRFELILGAVLVLLCTVVWHWQGPGDRLTQAEVDRYLQIIEAQVPIPAAEKADYLARLRAFGENDDGQPPYLLNLMRFFDTLHRDAGIPAEFEGSPEAANDYYDSIVVPLALARSAWPIFAGSVSGVNLTTSAAEADRWDRIAVMRYPTRRNFFEMLTDPAYAQAAPYKLGALDIALVPSRAEVVLPEIRLMAIFVAVITFLAIGWLRAARHR